MKSLGCLGTGELAFSNTLKVVEARVGTVPSFSFPNQEPRLGVTGQCSSCPAGTRTIRVYGTDPGRTVFRTFPNPRTVARKEH